MDNLLKSSSVFVSKLLKENSLQNLLTIISTIPLEVFEAATELGQNSNLSDEELEIIQVAAWFHDTGFINGYLNHEYKSAEIAKVYLENILIPVGKIERITHIIRMTERTNVPESLSDKIIRDADILHVGKEKFLL